jgi:hypothetical protein
MNIEFMGEFEGDLLTFPGRAVEVYYRDLGVRQRLEE